MPLIDPLITVKETQCVAAGNLGNSLFQFVLGAYDKVSEFNCVIRRDLGNSSIDRRSESRLLLLFLSQIVVIRLSERDKPLIRGIPSAVVAIGVLDVVIVHVGQRQVIRIRVFAAQIDTEVK